LRELNLRRKKWRNRSR